MKILHFGNKENDTIYCDRPGAYAVFVNDKDEIGVVENNGYYFLPGGGIEKNETESAALIREVREETGIEVEIVRQVGRANEFQISFDKKSKLNQIDYFYKCIIVTEHNDQSDKSHIFKWVNFENAKSKISRQNHTWALTLAFEDLDTFVINYDSISQTGIYRLIQSDELEILLQLYNHLHSNDDRPKDSNVFIKVWNEIVNDPKIFYFVADLKGQFICSCHLILVPNLTRGCSPYGIIENVVTHSDYRANGIGKGILRYALNVAWAFGCYKVMLMTGSKKEWVHKFYEDAGFEKNTKTAFLAKQ